MAIITTASAWLITLSIVGTTTQRVKRIPVTAQYLAAASFWVYVIHHPFLGLIHTDLKWLLPTALPAVKTLLAFTTCTGFSLLLYEGLVRKTRLGRLLGFAWSLPAEQETDDAEEIISIDGSPQPIEPPARRAA